jgi:hypothetical protein
MSAPAVRRMRLPPRFVPMDHDIKTRWVAALRSGTYHQHHLPRLRDGDTYSPIGVLCDLRDPDGWAHDEEGWDTWQGYCLGVPDSLLTWASLHWWPRCCIGEYGLDPDVTFADIADYIEEAL